MKRSIKSLTGFTLTATDGEVGSLKDFYFDDQAWTVRYLVVETGGWLSARRVLLSPQAIQHAGWEEKTFHVNLTREQIKNSPAIDTDKPGSQHEAALTGYYAGPAYWSGALWTGVMGATGRIAAAPPLEQLQEENKEQEETGDPHLRSIEKVTGYTVHAMDGDIGDIEDFLLDDLTFTIDFFVVDTGKWLPGKKVVLSPLLISKIDWATSEVTVHATVEDVKNQSGICGRRTAYRWAGRGPAKTLLKKLKNESSLQSPSVICPLVSSTGCLSLCP
jgi:hypothetical protein